MKITFFGYKFEQEQISDFLKNHSWLTYDPDNYEAIIVFGGDGTFLSALKAHFNEDVMLILLNTGSLGFYASDIKIDQNTFATNDFASFNYLQLTTDSKKTYFAINEFLVTATNTLLDYEVEINNTKWYKFCGTGFLVCTPNGSTGMNRSLNGPILVDKHTYVFQEFLPARNFNKTTLFQPVVLNEKHHLSLNILQPSPQTINLKFDGQNETLVAKTLNFEIKQSKAKIYLFHDTTSWINKIRNKLIGE